MQKKKVLFVCIHNSARSQMAEAFLNSLGKEKFQASSAGLEPGKLNPVVVELMEEAGIDISGNRTKDVNEFLNSEIRFDFIVTVCDETSAEKCPVFPGPGMRLHWSFPDPSLMSGTNEEKLVQVRIVRDTIKKKIEEFVSEVS